MLRVTILGCGGSGGVPLLGGRDEGGEWGDCDPAEPRNRRTRTSAMIASSLMCMPVWCRHSAAMLPQSLVP